MKSFVRLFTSSWMCLFITGLLVFLLGCGEDHARLRVVHASPDAPNVDVLVDGKSVLTNVPYATASDYLTVTAGTRRIEVRPTGTSTDVINSNVSLSSHSDSTVLAEGFAAVPSPAPQIAAVVLTDDNSNPASGKAKVRVIHAAPSAGNVDVYIVPPGTDITTVSPTLSNVAFEAASGYLSVDPATYEVVVTPAGNNTVIAIDVPNFTVAAGQIRSAVALDAPGGGAPFQLIVLSDKN
ncbi:MAG TPA: DUF4397 domain-containing protein [Terriglobales bacterium]|jgi:hypothetical protein|nr:DUF4397 domain-containing protein [Terriglobales bacterium]